ncbi:MAG: type I DNA topoisomerase [Sphingomonadales bacterium]
MNLVVVESPAKAKTINKYLGGNFVVLASYGHVRDLPSKDGSVLPDQDFEMCWETSAESRKRMRAITDAAKDADTLYLATDPDREGEAISWHVLELLKRSRKVKNLTVRRVVFNEITKPAVLHAMANPRDLDQELIDAYLARRALDYLVGFTLSPVLWRKLPGARSAGRVQSVTLRLISDREFEIESFKAREYWTVGADFLTERNESFTARLVSLNGKKLTKFGLAGEVEAKQAVAAINDREFTVNALESKPVKRNPNPPFTTATLQQEAARKLGFAASHTMRVAQKLYEGINVDGEVTGLITYMRTDGVQIANEALSASRTAIAQDFGDRYVPPSARVYKTKAKNAQEAHEAIRPTDPRRRPSALRAGLDSDQFRLYELIWKRTIASQMASAELQRTTVDIQSPDQQAGLRTTGAVVRFDGFLKLYQEGRDENGDDESSKRLPVMEQGEALERAKVTSKQHFTEPPPRFTEASLVKKLEELGIGRPSTYASILEVLRARSYVRMERNRFVPEDKGRLVTAFLQSFFKRYVEYDFTADLEQELDEISAGKIGWQSVLQAFWKDFREAVDGTSELKISEVLDALNDLLASHIFPPLDGESDPRSCPRCDDGRLSLKLGKFGAFIGCSNYPDCRHTRQLSGGDNGNGDEQNGPQVLGRDPETDLEVSIRTGRFGPYIQLGDTGDYKDGTKPKRASIPKDQPSGEVDFERALALLSLPRAIGDHPETGKPITTAFGRYGPYLAHDGKYASLESSEEVFTVGLNRAVTLLAEAATKSKGRRGPEVIRELGAHPDDQEPIRLLTGRYGPYVKHKAVNATVPKGQDLDALTLEEAVTLIAAKAKKKRPGGRKKPAAKKAATKKTTAKKTTRKKTKAAV